MYCNIQQTGSSTPTLTVLYFGQQVWTSDELFCPGGPPGGPPGGRELCSLLNEAIRADDPGLLEAVIHTHARTHARKRARTNTHVLTWTARCQQPA